MPIRQRSIAIVGAGMGGLAAAATLLRIGMKVDVYEQAARFARVGAGIQMMPNSMKVLRGIGVEDSLRRTSFKPFSHLDREWDTGRVLRELPIPEDLFGAPYLCTHRADLTDALVSINVGRRPAGWWRRPVQAVDVDRETSVAAIHEHAPLGD